MSCGHFVLQSVEDGLETAMCVWGYSAQWPRVRRNSREHSKPLGQAPWLPSRNVCLICAKASSAGAGAGAALPLRMDVAVVIRDGRRGRAVALPGTRRARDFFQLLDAPLDAPAIAFDHLGLSHAERHAAPDAGLRELARQH